MKRKPKIKQVKPVNVPPEAKKPSAANRNVGVMDMVNAELLPRPLPLVRLCEPDGIPVLELCDDPRSRECISLQTKPWTDEKLSRPFIPAGTLATWTQSAIDAAYSMPEKTEDSHLLVVVYCNDGEAEVMGTGCGIGCREMARELEADAKDVWKAFIIPTPRHLHIESPRPPALQAKPVQPRKPWPKEKEKFAEAERLSNFADGLVPVRYAPLATEKGDPAGDGNWFEVDLLTPLATDYAAISLWLDWRKAKRGKLTMQLCLAILQFSYKVEAIAESIAEAGGLPYADVLEEYSKLHDAERA